MKKNKFYVVWSGRVPGIYESWEQCREQVDGFPQVKYKGFKTRKMAEIALEDDYREYYGKTIIEPDLSEDELRKIGSPILESISVDGAWNTTTGVVEYQGVDTLSKKVLFKVGPFNDGTINIVEFLAIVHALAYCKQNQLTLPIYSDSRNAINWVKKKQTNTYLEKTESNIKLFELIDRAIKWLNENEYPNLILKWHTKAWGENPADFDRK
jgi:ribonuclease HI